MGRAFEMPSVLQNGPPVRRGGLLGIAAEIAPGDGGHLGRGPFGPANVQLLLGQVHVDAAMGHVDDDPVPVPELL